MREKHWPAASWKHPIRMWPQPIYMPLKRIEPVNTQSADRRSIHVPNQFQLWTFLFFLSFFLLRYYMYTFLTNSTPTPIHALPPQSFSSIGYAYMHAYKSFSCSLISPISPYPPHCNLTVCLFLYCLCIYLFVHQFIMFFIIHKWVRSCGVFLSLTGLFHSA